MPLPEVHPLHEIPVSATTASVANGQTASVRAPFAGRVASIAASPTTATTGGTATCTATIGATTVGVISIPISTATSTSVGTNTACAEGDMIAFAFTGAGTAGGVTGVTAYVRRGG